MNATQPCITQVEIPRCGLHCSAEDPSRTRPRLSTAVMKLAHFATPAFPSQFHFPGLPLLFPVTVSQATDMQSHRLSPDVLPGL